MGRSFVSHFHRAATTLHGSGDGFQNHSDFQTESPFRTLNVTVLQILEKLNGLQLEWLVEWHLRQPNISIPHRQAQEFPKVVVVSNRVGTLVIDRNRRGCL